MIYLFKSFFLNVHIAVMMSDVSTMVKNSIQKISTSMLTMLYSKNSVEPNTMLIENLEINNLVLKI